MSGKKATSSAPAAGAACACLRSSWSWGATRSAHARDATTSPPAIRSALSVTPKKPISAGPERDQHHRGRVERHPPGQLHPLEVVAVGGDLAVDQGPAGRVDDREQGRERDQEAGDDALHDPHRCPLPFSAGDGVVGATGVSLSTSTVSRCRCFDAAAGRWGHSYYLAECCCPAAGSPRVTAAVGDRQERAGPPREHGARPVPEVNPSIAAEIAARQGCRCGLQFDAFALLAGPTDDRGFNVLLEQIVLPRPISDGVANIASRVRQVIVAPCFWAL